MAQLKLRPIQVQKLQLPLAHAENLLPGVRFKRHGHLRHASAKGLHHAGIVVRRHHIHVDVARLPPLAQERASALVGK